MRTKRKAKVQTNPEARMMELGLAGDRSSKARIAARKAREAADRAEDDYRELIRQSLTYPNAEVRELARRLAVHYGIIANQAELDEWIAKESNY